MKIERIVKNDGRVFVVGDLHGCYTLLMEKLDEIGFNKETDLLLSVGDLIDRGQENLECLKLMDEPWFKCVKGNHEDMAYRGVMGDDQYLGCWMMNGGAWYDPLNAEHVHYIKKTGDLPNFIEITYGGFTCLIGHADYPENEYAFDKPFNAHRAMWSRDRISNSDYTEIKGIEFVILGHTPVSEPSKYGNRYYIDTGAVFCGKLSVMELPSL